MNNLLREISNKAIELADLKFSHDQIENQWLGTMPAPEAEIKRTEERLGVQFPADFKQFLSITNGFIAPNDVEPTFEPIDKIDYLKNLDSITLEAYSIEGIEDIGKQLEKSIVVAGINQEQYFLLIPPNPTHEQWKYWKFASWLQGEEEYEGLESYFNYVLSFLNETILSKNYEVK